MKLSFYNIQYNVSKSSKGVIHMAMKKVNSSVVLSVSIGKGCYRHIQLSLNETLEELADTIIWAFDFCNLWI